MIVSLEHKIDIVLGHVTSFSQRFALPIIIAAVILAIACVRFAASNLGISTDTEKMLSKDLPWRVAHESYKQDFPYYADNIVVVVDGATPDLASEAAALLTRHLRQHPVEFAEVFYPANDPFFRRQQFLYLDTEDLEQLADDLSEAQPFLARLAEDRTARGFFSVLSEAIDATLDGEQVSIAATLHRVGSAINEQLNGDATPMSWQTLIAGDIGSSDGNREIFIVTPKLDFSRLFPGQVAVDAIRRLADEYQLTPPHGVRVRLTGSAALAYDELKSVGRGAETAGLLSLLMVAVCLFVGLRSPALVVATVTSLVLGLIFTATFAAVAVGALNMISIAFAVLYVGLGVDFAVHVCLRYRELAAAMTRTDALNLASRHVGGSLTLCAITTAIGFFAFIPTSYSGVAELGLISGAGIFISLICSFTVLPAILHLLPIDARSHEPPHGRIELAAFPVKHARSIVVIAVLVAALCLLAATKVRFDHNPLDLNDPDAESVLTFRELLSDSEISPYSVSVVAESKTESHRIARLLENKTSVDSVSTIDDLIPDEQAEKLAIIEDLTLVLGPDLEVQPVRVPELSEDLAAYENLRREITRLVASKPDPRLLNAATTLADALDAMGRHMEPIDDNQNQALFAALERKLLGSFDARIERLLDGLDASAATTDDLPEAIRKRWQTPDGRYRLEILPQNDLSKNHAMEEFVSEVRSVVGDTAVGLPVINIGGSRAVIDAFYQAFISAFIVISILLWFLLRRVADVLVVLAPLTLAGLITAASTVLMDRPFNFANIIALPLLLGIGVDSSLHILHRYRTALPVDGLLLQTSTARAVLFSALTTAASFGTLAISDHAGTASMGLLLTIGIVASLLCTLIVQPAILHLLPPGPDTT
jgi:hopanoid biosynthesis associated RND transporter like protein HpnN